jgi:hypothetical protein
LLLDRTHHVNPASAAKYARMISQSKVAMSLRHLPPGYDDVDRPVSCQSRRP